MNNNFDRERCPDCGMLRFQRYQYCPKCGHKYEKIVTQRQEPGYPRCRDCMFFDANESKAEWVSIDESPYYGRCMHQLGNHRLKPRAAKICRKFERRRNESDPGVR